MAQIRGNLQKTMQADAAVFRTQACSQGCHPVTRQPCYICCPPCTPWSGLQSLYCQAVLRLLELDLNFNLLTYQATSAFMASSGAKDPAQSKLSGSFLSCEQQGPTLCELHASYDFMHGHAPVQETLEEGCKKIDDIVESFDDVGLRDRSMVWNTDLVEVMSQPQPLPCISHDQLTRLVHGLTLSSQSIGDACVEKDLLRLKSSGSQQTASCCGRPSSQLGQGAGPCFEVLHRLACLTYMPSL